MTSVLSRRSPAFRPSNRLDAVQFSPIVTTLDMADQLQGMVMLSQGVPSFATPEHILEATARAIVEHRADVYSDTAGLFSLREEICAKLRSKNHIIANPDQIVVTAGAAEGILLALLLLTSVGDEVILASPGYCTYIEQAYLAGVDPVFMPLIVDNSAWRFDTSTLEELIRARTVARGRAPACIIICTPQNPTGVVHTKDVLIDIAQTAARYGVSVITDEIYEDYVFEGHEHFSLASEPDIAANCVSCFSFSKSYGMTGWRVGYVVLPKAAVSQAKQIWDDLAICAPTVSQYAALAALTGPQNCIDEYRAKLVAQRAILVSGIRDLRFLNLVLGHGAFYLFPELAIPMTSIELRRHLAEEAGVLVVPGVGFGPTAANHVRLSFTSSEANIKQAVERLQEWEKQLSATLHLS